MSKKTQNANKKAKLETKQINEAFQWQVTLKKRQIMPGAGTEDLDKEIAAVCESGLAQDMLTLRDIIVGVKNDLGFIQEEMGTLLGSPAAFFLGISSYNPYLKSDFSTVLLCIEKQPLQVEVYYDNDVRNQVVEWVKKRYNGVTTRLGQPILKLKNMVVAFKRVVK